MAYAIGVAKPVSVYVSTVNSHVAISDAGIAEIISNEIDLTPAGIINRLKLRNPIYQATASFGHFGRIPNRGSSVTKLSSSSRGEKLDLVDKFKEVFNL